jgi:hypothetical protein
MFAVNYYDYLAKSGADPAINYQGCQQYLGHSYAQPLKINNLVYLSCQKYVLKL